MKHLTRLFFAGIALFSAQAMRLEAQAMISKFDFNHVPLTDASYGPNAIAVDANAISDGTAAYINANCGALKGIDITVPNGAGIFDVPSIEMEFSFRKTESRSDFFVRGGTSFVQTGGQLFVSYRTTDGGGGYIDYGPYSTAFSPLTDGNYHVYSFAYLQGTGMATVKVDGTTTWSYNGPNNRPLYWTGAPTDVTIGTVMDGNCPGAGTLNYAYFSNPDVPLNVDYLSFVANQDMGNVDLAWETTAAENDLTFSVERSGNGLDFSTIATLPRSENPIFNYKDVQPGAGQWLYRVRQVGKSGSTTYSEVVSIVLGADDYAGFVVWPNPATGHVQISFPSDITVADVSVMDLQGRMVLVAVGVTQGASINLSSLSPGLYSLGCLANGKRIHRFVLLE